jgi:hypothetical protein
VRAVAIAFVLVGLAIAVNGVRAESTEAAPSALTISVERPVYEIPSGRLNMWVPIRFSVGGQAGRRIDVWYCRNGRFYRDRLRYSWPPCSSDDSVFGQPTGDSWVDQFDNAGRYEAFARTSDEISNFATFTVLDECRWTVIKDEQSFGHSEPGMPYHCNHHRNGLLELRADDGSRLISTGYGNAMRNRYYPNRLSNPDLRFGVGDSYNRPAIGSLRLKTGPTIGGFLVHVNTPNGMIATFGRADFRVSHARRLTRVRVFSGKVIVTARPLADHDLGDWVEHVCNGRVSLRCLSRMSRTLTLKKGQSRKIRAR